MSILGADFILINSFFSGCIPVPKTVCPVERGLFHVWARCDPKQQGTSCGQSQSFTPEWTSKLQVGHNDCHTCLLKKLTNFLSSDFINIYSENFILWFFFLKFLLILVLRITWSFDLTSLDYFVVCFTNNIFIILYYFILSMWIQNRNNTLSKMFNLHWSSSGK